MTEPDYIIIPPMEPHMIISREAPCRLEYIFFNPLLLFGRQDALYLSVYQLLSAIQAVYRSLPFRLEKEI